MSAIRLPRCTPEKQGVSSAAILAFIETVEENLHELHSFMLLRHGNVVAEGWWSPYKSHYPHMLLSLSKSFCATAVGLAIAEGRLSLDDLVLSFFPDEAPDHPNDYLGRLRVRDLLTMTTGHTKDTMVVESSSSMRIGTRPDGKWIEGFFEMPLVYEPGTHFLYNSGASYLLSGIVQKLSGMKVVDYLKPRLFDPLGIENPVWESSPEGINCGGWGLSIKTEDIARFGQLYLQKGIWEGQRILPESWVESAISMQVSNGNQPDNDRQQGYGYQFWRCRNGAYRAEGGFGQFCIVIPSQGIVIAITAAVENAAMQNVMNTVWEFLLPGMGTSPLPEDPASQDALIHKLTNLELRPPQGLALTPIAAAVSGKTYLMDPNPLGMDAFTFDFASDRTIIRLRIHGNEMVIASANGAWLDERAGSIAVSGTWTDQDTFVLTMRHYLTYLCDTFTFHFNQDQILVSGVANVSIASKEYPLMKGHLA